MLKSKVAEKNTTMRMSKRISMWIKQQARTEGVLQEEWLAAKLAIPDDYLPHLDSGIMYHDNYTEHKRLQSELRSTIISLLQESGGKMRYRKLIERIPEKMKVPPEWLVREDYRNTVYPTRISEFASLEYRYLIKKKIVSSPKNRHGYWYLSENPQ